MTDPTTVTTEELVAEVERLDAEARDGFYETAAPGTDAEYKWRSNDSVRRRSDARDAYYRAAAPELARRLAACERERERLREVARAAAAALVDAGPECVVCGFPLAFDLDTCEPGCTGYSLRVALVAASKEKP